MSVWTTRANELVGIGDMVALSMTQHMDVVGRIVAEADNGRIQVATVRGGSSKPGDFVLVEEDQLHVRVYR